MQTPKSWIVRSPRRPSEALRKDVSTRRTDMRLALGGENSLYPPIGA